MNAAAARSGLSAILFALLLVALPGCGAAATSGPAGPSGAAPVPDQVGDRIYAVSQEAASVAVLDAATGELVEVVDLTALGFPASSKPHHVAVEADGSHWYVSLIGAGTVLKLDRENRLVGQVEFETPGLLALDPTGDRLYVGRSMAAVSPPQRVGVLRRSTMEMEQEVDVFFPRPHAMAVDPVGERFFTASLAEDRLAWAPVGVEEVELHAIEAPGHHQMLVQFAVSPDGRWLVAGGQMTGTLLVWDITGEEPELRHTLDLGGQPWHPSFTPDGSELWVPRRTANAVTVVDVGTWTVDEVLEHPALVEPHGSAVSPDGRRIFVASRNTEGAYGSGGAPGTVVTFDRESREVVNVVEVGAYAAGMAAPEPWRRR